MTKIFVASLTLLKRTKNLTKRHSGWIHSGESVGAIKGTCHNFIGRYYKNFVSVFSNEKKGFSKQKINCRQKRQHSILTFSNKNLQNLKVKLFLVQIVAFLLKKQNFMEMGRKLKKNVCLNSHRFRIFDQRSILYFFRLKRPSFGATTFSTTALVPSAV